MYNNCFQTSKKKSIKNVKSIEKVSLSLRNIHLQIHEVFYIFSTMWHIRHHNGEKVWSPTVAWLLVPDGLAWVFRISKTAELLGFSHTTMSRLYTEWVEKQKINFVCAKDWKMVRLIQAVRIGIVTHTITLYNIGEQKSISTCLKQILSSLSVSFLFTTVVDCWVS